MAILRVLPGGSEPHFSGPGPYLLAALAAREARGRGPPFFGEPLLRISRRFFAFPTLFFSSTGILVSIIQSLPLP